MGFQEVVKLTAGKIIQAKDKECAALWTEIIQGSLKAIGDYIPVVQKIMVGCLIVVFAKAEMATSIRGIRKFSVKTGLGGMTGNKGCTAIRFMVDDTSLAFLNVHLESG